MNRTAIAFSSKYYQHNPGADRPRSATGLQAIINARPASCYCEVYEIIVDSASMLGQVSIGSLRRIRPKGRWRNSCVGNRKNQCGSIHCKRKCSGEQFNSRDAS